MKITVFTSNHPRHLALVKALAGIASEVHAIIESTTLFPGAVKDSLYNKSPVMKRYFDHVLAAEREIFGEVAFLPANVRTLNLKSGDINLLPATTFHQALQADYVVVFGASYIKSPLVEQLIAKRAINLHMGISPYYRGSACNFWAIRDGHPELVGATIHLLTKGLDSGDMLFHALPAAEPCEPFLLGMKAVKAAQDGLCEHIRRGTLFSLPTLPQNPAQQIRYSRNADFTDEVALAYLDSLSTEEMIGIKLKENGTSHALHNLHRSQ